MYCDNLEIRPTHSGDADSVWQIHRESFGRPDEADLAAALVGGPSHTISLIATNSTEPVGHVLLTEIGAPVRSAALASLAVVPSSREMQVGTQLVRKAIRAGRKEGFQAIFVVGEPGYYERFGFSAKLALPFQSAWPGPIFMALELKAGALAGQAGVLEYPRIFADN